MPFIILFTSNRGEVFVQVHNMAFFIVMASNRKQKGTELLLQFMRQRDVFIR